MTQHSDSTPQAVDAICLDLDDTLYDYHDYARAGLAAAGDHLEERTGTSYHDELLTLYFEADHTEGTFDVLVDRYDLSATLVPELVDAFHSATGPLDPYPETESVLAELTEAYELGLITDGRGGREKLRRLGIADYFDAVLVTPTIDRSKHDPVVYHRMLSALSVSPESVVAVGDDPRVDFAVPNELGMWTVRLRKGRYVGLDPPNEAATPDVEIERLAELPAVVPGDTTAVPRPEGPNVGGTDV